jgi:hypothetical protein
MTHIPLLVSFAAAVWAWRSLRNDLRTLSRNLTRLQSSRKD